MAGSLTIAGGTLLVGVAAKTARILAFDLGGRPQPGGFTFRDERTGCSSVNGLASDEDKRLWVVDGAAQCVRVFSSFGVEVERMQGQDGASGELPGLLSQPVDVHVSGHAEAGWVAVACGGERRHAVQLFDPDRRYTSSLFSLGDPGRPFLGVTRLSGDAEGLLVAEAGARRVQVFRGGAFRFAFQLMARGGEPLEPSALARLPDGRMVVGSRAPESALDLVDPSGRPLRRLASAGEGEGCVSEPLATAVVPSSEDHRARVFVLDSAGLRVQVFDLESRFLGAFGVDLATGVRRPGRARRGRRHRD